MVRRAILMEPPRKTSEDPVLRRSVGNTLNMKKKKIARDKTERSFCFLGYLRAKTFVFNTDLGMWVYKEATYL